MKKMYAIEIICALYILLFVYAAGSKLVDIDDFRIKLGQSPLITAYADWLAWFVPVLEILIAIMLTVSRLRLISLYMAFSLMVMFTAYIVAIMNFSFYIPCSCGGVLSGLGWSEHLVFNIVFVFLALVGIILCSRDDLHVRSIREAVNTI